VEAEFLTVAASAYLVGPWTVFDKDQHVHPRIVRPGLFRRRKPPPASGHRSRHRRASRWPGVQIIQHQIIGGVCLFSTSLIPPIARSGNQPLGHCPVRPPSNRGFPGKIGHRPLIGFADETLFAFRRCHVTSARRRPGRKCCSTARWPHRAVAGIVVEPATHGGPRLCGPARGPCRATVLFSIAVCPSLSGSPVGVRNRRFAGWRIPRRQQAPPRADSKSKRAGGNVRDPDHAPPPQAGGIGPNPTPVSGGNTHDQHLVVEFGVARRSAAPHVLAASAREHLAVGSVLQALLH